MSGVAEVSRIPDKMTPVSAAAFSAAQRVHEPSASGHLLAEEKAIRATAPSVLVSAVDLLDGWEDAGAADRPASGVLALAPSPFAGAVALARAGVGWRDRIGREWMKGTR
jgi:hypothetical protein